ncbi:hypothetical protein LCGC14_0444840 [marine sediment metagenome]|uniref:Uncharacterized protein n=1 Tax=marine sediment metagenome TaxID=412755 RepID=A0A0F9T2F7_9ZZZZ
MADHRPLTKLERSDILSAYRHVPYGDAVAEVPVDIIRRLITQVDAAEETLTKAGEAAVDLLTRAEAMQTALRMMWDWHGGPSGDLSCVAFRDKWGFADQDDYGEAAMHRGVKAALGDAS